MSDLTHDNSHYQGLNLLRFESSENLQSIAQVPGLEFLGKSVREFVSQSVALNTRRAYASDVGRFERWGGGIPCSPELVATYVATHAKTHKAATLRRWVASLSYAHSAIGLQDPTKTNIVQATLKGINRSVGAAPKMVNPLLRDDLLSILDAMAINPRDFRDKALLLIGFAGGFRRSELVALDVADIKVVRRGLIINIRRSKTDQEGNGRQIAIPFGRTRHCPVAAFEAWLETSGIRFGPIFRPINRHGRISEVRLRDGSVAKIVKERISAIGVDPSLFSGHSLRAGFATSAAQAGASSWQIRRQTGHQSEQMLARYIRLTELFESNAASAVL
ncbi:site-specific integrase [Agrobacterium sp. O3.4]|uniref:Site-specific integrase n=2 Tax=Rhizobium/Agrobacterium group TaxID=227290 RepID=A0A546XGK9_RHIRH|nr:MULTISPECIES: site-specific integrase [Rhizobium/Agrobacterium group]MCZ7468602.1 site-specific integrase [Rhizobium rhizogenes]TRA99821.1 site-specific integrase [Rhizobium rhizogenes]WHO10678.1 site-specific integrase [Agrobacterium cucumeris]